MEPCRIGALLSGLVVWVSLCLPGVWGQNNQNYGVSSYQPQYPAPSYNPKPQYYEKPTYYETYDVQVDYKEANQSRRCGVLPTVHRQYGYDKERVAFGEYPWQVAIMDTYYNYKCAGGLLSPRHVITSAYCVDSLNEDQIKVRVGEWDLQSDKNYEEVYKNYELNVCKKHPFYYVPQQYAASNNGPPPQASYDYQASYPVVILELSEDVDLDQYPHVEPLCVPEFYYLSKSYTNEYNSPPSYSYGYGQGQGQGQAQAQQGASQSKQDRNEEGADKDLECWVLGYQESPVEKIAYQSSTPYKPASYSYGESYNPSYSYESYEYSRTPRRAKVSKVESYQPNYPQQGYGYTPESDSYEAEYYYDACHADLGAPIFCLVGPKIEQEEYYPAYPVSYPESYAPPAYNPPAYTPPAYSPPTYSPPAYTPPAYAPPAYSPPTYAPPPPAYSAPRYRRQAPYYSPPAYAPPTYAPPAYAPPAYSPPTYNPAPYYEEYYPKYPIKAAEPYNRDGRRAVLYGVVQYTTQCTYAYGQEGNKVQATPAKDLVAWIQNVLHTPASQCGYQQPYSPPAYAPPAYAPPAYSPPAYSPPPYTPPAYSPPAYTPPAYSPPSYPAPSYNPPSSYSG